jgi:hypothetical protein
MERLGDKLKEARADERRETEEAKTNESKWSELTQNRILRCHGHDATTEWNEQNISKIWGMYQQAMKEGTNSASGIVDTFATMFHKDPNVLEGARPHFSISTTTANCIKHGRLCPQPGLLRYENIDEGLMPLAFVWRESDEILEDTNQEEEYQRSNHRTLEGEQARSGRSKVKKAPDTFSDTVELLRCGGNFSQCKVPDSWGPARSFSACAVVKILGDTDGTQQLEPDVVAILPGGTQVDVTIRVGIWRLPP